MDQLSCVRATFFNTGPSPTMARTMAPISVTRAIPHDRHGRGDKQRINTRNGDRLDCHSSSKRLSTIDIKLRPLGESEKEMTGNETPDFRRGGP